MAANYGQISAGRPTGGDKEWFTIDKTNGMGHGFQYQFWSWLRQLRRWRIHPIHRWRGHLDGLRSIFPTIPQLGTLDVDTNGNLFIGGGDTGASFGAFARATLRTAAVTPIFDQVTTVNLGGSIVLAG